MAAVQSGRPSRQLFPRLPRHNRLDIRRADVEAVGEFAGRDPLLSETAYLQHLILPELGVFGRSEAPAAMAEGVVAVGLVGVPPQVLDAIVGRVAIVVAADQAGRSWA